MVLHPNQTEILFCNDNGEIVVWDLRNGKVNAMYPSEQAGPIHSVSINTEGTLLAAANIAGSVVVWSLASYMAFKPAEKVRHV